MGYTGWDTHRRHTHGVRNTWSGIHGIGHTHTEWDTQGVEYTKWDGRDGTQAVKKIGVE